MDDVKWIFDGIGTAAVTFVLGLFIGGTATYKFTIRKNIKQTQKAEGNSKQNQIGEITHAR